VRCDADQLWKPMPFHNQDSNYVIVQGHHADRHAKPSKSLQLGGVDFH
jgi:hypothetical protein